MNNLSYTKVLKKHWQIVALITGIAVVASLLFSITQPFEYRASTKLLVIQNQTQNLDAYTATKSAEKIGKNLAQIVSSSLFYQEVIKLNPEIAQLFPQDPLKRRKAWQKDVEVGVVPETGILQINAYNESKVKAAELVQTVASVLIAKSPEFHGGGDQVVVKVIDDVFVGKYPVRPNLLLNMAFALVLGFVLSSIFLILNEARVLRKQMKQISIFDQPEEPPVFVEPEDTQFELPAEQLGVHLFDHDQELSYSPSSSKRQQDLDSADHWRIIEETN